MARPDASLAKLRREIDEIDDSLHDLLMRRGELQAGVGRAKAGEGVYIRPGREAMVLRRLMARHQGSFPKPVLVRIWREIFAAGLALQGDFSVSLLGSADVGGELRALASDHFGSLTPIAEKGTAARVMEAVSDGRAAVGVLPMPESEEREPWWPLLARRGEKVPRIIARLPFAAVPGRANSVEALAVGLAPVEKTGDDRGYLAIEAGSQCSRAALRRGLDRSGFALTDWKSATGRDGAAFYLVECKGVLAEDDPRLAALKENDSGIVSATWPLGGYAVPLSAEDLA